MARQEPLGEFDPAASLSRKVLALNDKDREQYLDILRFGCSGYPVDTIGHLIDQTEELLN